MAVKKKSGPEFLDSEPLESLGKVERGT